jgi:hypothetical protein
MRWAGEKAQESGGVWARLTSKRDPSSRKALLWMTANYGLGEMETVIVTIRSPEAA